VVVIRSQWVARVGVPGFANLETVAILAFATLRVAQTLKATWLSHAQPAPLSAFVLYVTEH
jgi:hypothetical protein